MKEFHLKRYISPSAKSTYCITINTCNLISKVTNGEVGF